MDDGSLIDHSRKSDYNSVYNALEDTSIKMLGAHDVEGGVYELRDPNNIQVGQVSFDGKDQFLAGKWYGQVVVSGRALSQREGLRVFLREVEKTHG